ALSEPSCAFENAGQAIARIDSKAKRKRFMAQAPGRCRLEELRLRFERCHCRRVDRGGTTEEDRSDSRIAGSCKEDIHQENDRRESLLMMHRKPTWLVEVSTGSAWRAAGR